MMNPDWLHWLAARGAVEQDGRILHYGRPGEEPAAVLDGSIITDLSHYGLLRAAGEDAAQFLQNQTGNDVRRVTPGYSQLNCYSSPKGRLFAVFRLFRIGESFILRLPAEITSSVHKRLQMFVLMSKVRLDTAGDALIRIGVAGPHALAALKDEFAELPQNVNDVSAGDLTVIRVPGNSRYEIYGPREAMQSLWQSLSSRLTPVGRDAWPLLDIMNGIPTIYSATSEHFVPQMTNLQLIDGLSFKKGCYPGQEVVARMQYLGKLKRRMYRFEFEAAHAPAAGAGIVALIDGDPHETGEIVDARPIGANRYAALAVLQSANLELPLRLKDASGPVLARASLPYEVTETPQTGG